MQELAGLVGEPAVVLERAASIAESRGLATSGFEELNGLLNALVDSGLDASRLVIDLGLVRDISYYTGVTFDIVLPGGGETVKLGGGGRYDGLVKALGGKDVPALGFAYTLEGVAEARDPARSRQNTASTNSAGSR